MLCQHTMIRLIVKTVRLKNHFVKRKRCGIEILRDVLSNFTSHLTENWVSPNYKLNYNLDEGHLKKKSTHSWKWKKSIK